MEHHATSCIFKFYFGKGTPLSKRSIYSNVRNLNTKIEEQKCWLNEVDTVGIQYQKPGNIKEISGSELSPDIGSVERQKGKN